MGFTEVKAYITAELGLEGNTLPTSDSDAYLVQKLNQAVAIISTDVKPIAYPWTSATAPTGFGTGTTTNGITDITLPQTFAGPIRKVYYDGWDIPMADAFYLEDLGSSGVPSPMDRPVWRVEGRTLRVTECTLSLLKVHAYKNLAFYAVGGGPPATYGGGTNPMASLPERFDLLPAYWALAHWPATPDSAVEMARMQMNLALYDSEMAALKQEINSAQSEEWTW